MASYKTLQWNTRILGVVSLGVDNFSFEIQTHFLRDTKLTVLAVRRL
jgi:hypothetical protein